MVSFDKEAFGIEDKYLDFSDSVNNILDECHLILKKYENIIEEFENIGDIFLGGGREARDILN